MDLYTADILTGPRGQPLPAIMEINPMAKPTNEGDSTGRFASPPCYAAELTPDYAEPLAVDPQQALDVARWRKAERERLRAARLAIPAMKRVEMAQSLAGHIDDLLADRFGTIAGRIVSGYWPIKGEFDLRFWLGSICSRGARVVLPVVETPRAPLVFRAWTPDTRMERGHWNIPVPPASAERLLPEVALAPLVGWDEAGYRLGYGGGYFDRTLAALSPRPFVIGVGFEEAQLPTIFPQPHDIPMSAIVTEAGLRRAKKE